MVRVAVRPSLPFVGVVVTGPKGKALDPDTRVEIAEAVAERFDIGDRVEVTLKPYKATRSQRANRYLWGVVYELMAKDQEMTAEEIHDAMVERFLPNEHKRIAFFNRLTGECLEVETDGRRSSKLTGELFFDFVERVREFARDFLNVQTPEPDKDYWRKVG
jgi:hypothetical protein